MKATIPQSERLHRFAHDLRNRLGGIHQVLQQLAPHSGDIDGQELALFAERQYFSAMRAVEGLLDDLAVERGTTRLERGPMDLAALVRRCVEDLGHRTGRKRQQVALDLPEALPMEGDERVLRDLITALVSNASKFSAPGAGIRVTCSKDAGMARVVVADDGVGLTPQDLDLLFERYAWLESRPTAGEAQGRSTLARARQWARLHGGELKASSRGPGKGSSFTLTLPC